jgi:hypothetical protein
MNRPTLASLRSALGLMRLATVTLLWVGVVVYAALGYWGAVIGLAIGAATYTGLLAARFHFINGSRRL